LTLSSIILSIILVGLTYVLYRRKQPTSSVPK
jgi:hypothetical protein